LEQGAEVVAVCGFADGLLTFSDGDGESIVEVQTGEITREPELGVD
jgi:hypothetical protein